MSIDMKHDSLIKWLKMQFLNRKMLPIFCSNLDNNLLLQIQATTLEGPGSELSKL